jgi:hypothetical protein
MTHWITFGIIVGIAVVGYVLLILWGRRKQRQFDEQYDAAKRNHDVFVLQKMAVWERPPGSKIPVMKVKTYQVKARMNLSQLIKGVEISRMQTVTLRTTKSEFKKIEPSHRYKMEVAGNYIGKVFASAPQRKKKKRR